MFIKMFITCMCYCVLWLNQLSFIIITVGQPLLQTTFWILFHLPVRVSDNGRFNCIIHYFKQSRWELFLYDECMTKKFCILQIAWSNWYIWSQIRWTERGTWSPQVFAVLYCGMHIICKKINTYYMYIIFSLEGGLLDLFSFLLLEKLQI